MPTVLVADDQIATRAHIASRLLDAGFDVLEAADGEDAWEQDLCRCRLCLCSQFRPRPEAASGFQLLT